MNYRQITSGGCGSQWLAGFMRSKCGMAFPKGWNGHARDPKKNAAPENKIVYLTGDPFDQILSFDRRGFFLSGAHCGHMNGDTEAMKHVINAGIDRVIELGKDPFLIEDHIRGG